MVPPLEIVYHDVTRSEALEGHIREQAGDLAEACHELCGCKVTLERQHPRGRCQVRLELHTLPGEELVAVREPGDASPVVEVLDRLFDDAREHLAEVRARHEAEARTRRMDVLTAL